MRLLLICTTALLLALAASASASPKQETMFEAPRELLSDDSALRAETFSEIEGFGVDWLRVILYWRNAAPDADARTVPAFDERDPNAYDLARYDRLIEEARSRGMHVLLTVSGPVPTWATRSRRGHTDRPSPTRFARFMTALGLRYQDDVSHWSIWNEPNHPQFLTPQYRGDDPYSGRWYRKLVWAADKGLRASGNARDPMLIGETAPRGTGKVVAPLTFLRQTACLTRSYRKKRGCGELPADGYAHHAYTTRAGPWFEPDSPNDVTIGALGRLNTALHRAGRANALRSNMGIYLTEFGIQSRPDPFLGVSETAQAEYRSISERMAYYNPRVRAFSQYLMRDDAPRAGPASSRYSGFESGLRRHDGNKKRAFEGFRLPLVAARGDSRTTLWGLVRPAQGRTRVSIAYRGKGSSRWRRLKGDSTNSKGYWKTTTSRRVDRRYRVTWIGPDGTRHTGPLTRSYPSGR